MRIIIFRHGIQLRVNPSRHPGHINLRFDSLVPITLRFQPAIRHVTTIRHPFPTTVDIFFALFAGFADFALVLVHDNLDVLLRQLRYCNILLFLSLLVLAFRCPNVLQL